MKYNINKIIIENIPIIFEKILGARDMQPDKNETEEDIKQLLSRTRNELYHFGKEQEGMLHEIYEINRTISHLKRQILIHRLLIILILIIFIIIMLYFSKELHVLSKEIADLSQKIAKTV